MWKLFKWKGGLFSSLQTSQHTFVDSTYVEQLFWLEQAFIVTLVIEQMAVEIKSLSILPMSS